MRFSGSDRAGRIFRSSFRTTFRLVQEGRKGDDQGGAEEDEGLGGTERTEEGRKGAQESLKGWMGRNNARLGWTAHEHWGSGRGLAQARPCAFLATIDEISRMIR